MAESIAMLAVSAAVMKPAHKLAILLGSSTVHARPLETQRKDSDTAAPRTTARPNPLHRDRVTLPALGEELGMRHVGEHALRRHGRSVLEQEPRPALGGCERQHFRLVLHLPTAVSPATTSAAPPAPGS